MTENEEFSNKFVCERKDNTKKINKNLRITRIKNIKIKIF